MHPRQTTASSAQAWPPQRPFPPNQNPRKLAKTASAAGSYRVVGGNRHQVVLFHVIVLAVIQGVQVGGAAPLDAACEGGCDRAVKVVVTVQ